MKRIVLFVVAVVVTSCLTPCDVSSQAFNAKLEAKLQATLDTMVSSFSNNTKGVAAGVYCPGQGQWLGASGISHPGTPLSAEMAQGIASNSKLFSAVAILKLSQAGVLKLSDPLSKWIASYKNVNPSITILQLLNHTSGVSDPFLTTALLDTLQKYPLRVYTPQDILALLGPPTNAPGAGYNYSNVNYILAGMVVQSATGRSMAKLIRDSILTPLHLDHTFYDVEEPEIGTLAFRWHNGVDIHDSSRVSLNTAGGPAGSIFSTPADMLSWYTTLMNGGVLSAESFAALTKFVSPQNYALGLQKTTFFGRETWGHGGSFPGYKSRVIYDPCMQATVVCLSNDDWSAVDGITATLYKVLVDNLPLCAGTLNGPDTLCRNQLKADFTTASITHASAYVWSFPDGTSDTTSVNHVTHEFSKNFHEGVVTVCGINDYGVGVSTNHKIVLVSIAPTISISGQTLSCDTLASSYQWLQCSTIKQAISGATARTYTPSVSGSYAVVASRGQCSDTSDCVSVSVSDVELSNSAEVAIHTDYTRGLSIVTLPRVQGAQEAASILTIEDSAGRLISRSETASQEVHIEHVKMTPGVYFVRVQRAGAAPQYLRLLIP